MYLAIAIPRIELGTIKIPLTHGKFSIIDEDDLDKVSSFKWYYSSDGYAKNSPYLKNHKLKKLIMHRLITNCSIGLEVDHINGDRLDNRKCNLRICNRSQNSRNKTPIGVTYHKGGKRIKRWRAQIYFDNKNHTIGYFLEKEDAIKAHWESRVKLFGEYSGVQRCHI